MRVYALKIAPKRKLTKTNKTVNTVINSVAMTKAIYGRNEVHNYKPIIIIKYNDNDNSKKYNNSYH